MSRYAVGIDLGTTNCALAYVDLDRAKRTGSPTVETLEIQQLIELDETGKQPLLPSFVYLVAEHELDAVTASLPWTEKRTLVGEAARRQGVRVPGRLVGSAKSWLCHGGVDRKANILPWDADEEVPRISPVHASTLFLAHLREAWNHTIAKGDSALALEKQRLVLTVPASFDEVARELTVQAAKAAGLEKFTLLEEPQAAFYHWLNSQGWQESDSETPPGLPPGATCVVIDCGGGTTDFSLIGVVEREGKARYERLAVGDHLLLGGDNMDLAIARHIEQTLSPNKRLDSAQWGNLVASARRAKEQMLGPQPPESQTVTVMGRGRKLIGSSLRYELNRQTLKQLTLDGFFPNVGFGEDPTATSRGGLQEYGLPYVADPAVTRHLAAFLRHHGDTIRNNSPTGSIAPHAVLFNGGVFNAQACREQILRVMQSWFGAGWEPTVLQTESLDLSVSRGAAYYAWVRATGAQRIKSGAARSYYVGVATDTATDDKATVICLVPHGLEEGDRIQLEQPEVELQIGQPVTFPIYSSTVRTHDKPGQVIAIQPGQLHELPAITTVLKGGRRAGTKTAAVQLEAGVTEVGTLELFCAEKNGSNRWLLQFQIRTKPGSSEEATKTGDQVVTETWSQEELAGAEQVLKQGFPEKGKADTQLVQQLPKHLEQALELSRSQWPTPLLRGLWEFLRELAPRRSQSVEHEWRWYNLAGYCLRPGWGDPLDAFRVEQLWKIAHQGVLQAKSDRCWIEYWILWRRVAGGLDANRQNALAKRLLAFTIPGRKPPRRVNTHELAEIWRALASLEHLDAKRKVELGDLLLKQARKAGVDRHTFWCVTRFGARVPLYGPINCVVPKATAEQWIEILLAAEELDERQKPERDFALAQLSRRSGDRARDIDESLRDRVLAHLRKENVAERWQHMVEQVAELESVEESQLLGDALPPGLRLLQG